ncbi:MAG: pantoate--beta-alanine ligase [Rhodospirillales bacterium]|nr:pantoate--beta-alanine ligase [Rhodospirillales bacterium]
MATGLGTVRNVAELRSLIAGWRGQGQSVGLVPTMGALHEGHFSLVRASLTNNDRTCVTLFINPKQFGEGEDLGTYPRDEAADTAALERLGADALFAPAAVEMYPEGSATSVSVPGLGDMLEGEFRPGFFTGVATVVTKLLIQALPDQAFFGEKDYQQLCVVRRLATDLNIPTEIIACPIVREDDGLALSSRNAYLSFDERRLAPSLHAALAAAAAQVVAGADPSDAAELAKRAILEAGFGKVDYIAIRDSDSLQPLVKLDGRARILGAAWIGKTRLIDNLSITG